MTVLTTQYWYISHMYSGCGTGAAGDPDQLAAEVNRRAAPGDRRTPTAVAASTDGAGAPQQGSGAAGHWRHQAEKTVDHPHTEEGSHRM